MTNRYIGLACFQNTFHFSLIFWHIIKSRKKEEARMYWFNLKEGLKRCFMWGKLLLPKIESDLTIHDFCSLFSVMISFLLCFLSKPFIYTWNTGSKLKIKNKQIVNSSDSGQFLATFCPLTVVFLTCVQDYSKEKCNVVGIQKKWWVK